MFDPLLVSFVLTHFEHNLQKQKISRSIMMKHRTCWPYLGQGAALCAPSLKSHHIFKTALSLKLLLCDFYFYVSSITKSSVPPIIPHVCSHGNHATFGLILKPRTTIVFQVFPHERNFMWDILLCFGHHNTLRSLIIANIRTATMETFQKIILPKYGHRHQTNWIVSCFTVYNQHTGILSGVLSLFFLYYIFSSFKCFELSYCSSTDFDGFGGTRKQLNIPLVP